MLGPYTPRQNQLLRQLPDSDLARLLPHLELAPMPLGEVLLDGSQPPRQVYFPTTAVLSLVQLPPDGIPAEVAVVGSEGMVGLGLVFGEDQPALRGVVQCAGYGYRIRSAVLRQEFDHTEALRGGLGRFEERLRVQMTQTASCQREHSPTQQFCRWILLSLDRLAQAQPAAEPHLIATILGQNRDTVADATAALQACGLIRYARGHITVLDRVGLEAMACACYQALRWQFSPRQPDIVA